MRIVFHLVGLIVLIGFGGPGAGTARAYSFDVETLAPTGITSDSARLCGRVLEPTSEACEYHFVYWSPWDPDPVWISTPWRCCTFRGNVFSETIWGLTPGTSYVFFAEARDSWRTGSGSTWDFVTLSRHTVQISSGEGGTVKTPGEGSFTYAHGAYVPIVAEADAGYKFFQWTGTAVGAEAVSDPCSASTMLFVYNDYTLVANFVALSGRQTLQISAGKGGSVKPAEGTYTYPDGADVSIEAIPDSGYRFTNWSGNFWSTLNPATIQMTRDYRVQANFASADQPDRPALGYSLGQWTFDAMPEGGLRDNNFKHASNPLYDRLHVELVRRSRPDLIAMMRMRNLRDLDPASATYGETIFARAKALFGGYTGPRVLVRFSYLFEQSAPGLELTARLSDVPELLDRTDRKNARHYAYIGRAPAPPEDRPGSISGRRFGVFEGWVSTASLDLSRQLYVELELAQTGRQTGPAPRSYGGIQLASSEGDGGSVLVDDLAVEVHCDGICLDLNWSDTADEEDFLLVIASSGYAAGLVDGGLGSRYCLDGAFSSDGYVDSYDVHSWDWALYDTSRVACNYCRVPLPLADAGSGTIDESLSLSSSAGDVKLAGVGGFSGDLLVLGKSRMKKTFSDVLKDRYSMFDSKMAYQGDYMIAGLPNRCDIRVVRGPADHIYAVNTESGVLRIDGRVETVIPPGQASVASDPRYGGPATVYIGMQGQGSTSFGRPVLDAAFDAQGNAYVVPVIVQPQSGDAYVSAARLQLRQSGTPLYRIVQLYDDPPLPNDNQRRDCLREIEVDGAGNVYLVNVHALNESCILWKYGADGVLRQRVDLMSPSSPVRIPDPIALHVSHDGQILYLVSGQRDPQTPDSTKLYGLSTQDFSLVRSVTIGNMEQVTSVTEEPVTGCLWVTGVSMPEVPMYPSPMDEPFYVPFLAKVPPQTGTADAFCIADPEHHDLALPTSIVWVGDE